MKEVNGHIQNMSVDPLCESAVFMTQLMHEYASALKKLRHIDLILADKYTAYLKYPLRSQSKANIPKPKYSDHSENVCLIIMIIAQNWIL